MSLCTEKRCLEPKALKVKLDTGAPRLSAGRTQKKRKTVVQKKSADTQEYDSRQQNDTNVDTDKNKGE